jgi:hypothetical protein
MSICVPQEDPLHRQPIGLWCGDSSMSFIYLNLVCLGWRDYTLCIASVLSDLNLAMIELISFSLNKVAVDGHSMIFMYIDCGFDVLSLAAYPSVGVITSGMIEVFVSICVAHHRRASVRWHVEHGSPSEMKIILRTRQEFQCIFDLLGDSCEGSNLFINLI